MVTKIFLLKTLLFIGLFPLTNNATGQKKLQGYEDLLRTTALLLDTIRNSAGSSVLVESKKRFFLVTAEHVSSTLSDSALAIISDEWNRPKVYRIKELSKGKSLNFKNHKTADVSAIEILPIDTFLRRHLPKFALDEEYLPEYYYLETANRRDLHTFYGYPSVGLFYKSFQALKRANHFTPFSFRAYPSSELLEIPRIDKPSLIQKFFLTENPGMQGYSGGPVFYGQESNFILRGIVHGTVGDKTGGKMAMVVPIEYIKSLLNEF
jgi:hypothetical protein